MPHGWLKLRMSVGGSNLFQWREIQLILLLHYGFKKRRRIIVPSFYSPEIAPPSGHVTKQCVGNLRS